MVTSRSQSNNEKPSISIVGGGGGDEFTGIGGGDGDKVPSELSSGGDEPSRGGDDGC